MSVKITVKLGDSLGDIVKDAAAKMMLDLHAGLVLATPVDEGVARAGWTVDTDALVVENTVPYINRLNDGHSKQAPAGFVETEIDKATRL